MISGTVRQWQPWSIDSLDDFQVRVVADRQAWCRPPARGAQSTWKPREVIVVDVESTDDSRAVAASFDDTIIIRNSKQVAAEGRNIGASRASQPYLAFLDADDLWPERRIELQLARLLEDPRLDIVTGGMQQFRTGAQGEVVPLGPPVPSNCRALRSSVPPPFWRVGPFSSRWKVGETVEWYTRASDGGLRIAAIPETVVLRRLHERNSGRTVKAPMHSYLEMLHSALQRRRQAGLIRD
jgi:glycosyltransferase involved in cell wall biosynthesis